MTWSPKKPTIQLETTSLSSETIFSVQILIFIFLNSKDVFFFSSQFGYWSNEGVVIATRQLFIMAGLFSLHFPRGQKSKNPHFFGCLICFLLLFCSVFLHHLLLTTHSPHPHTTKGRKSLYSSQSCKMHNKLLQGDLSAIITVIMKSRKR